jgi:FKBP-type peptidyl-prolyl cis-trans isomerase FklB
MSLLPEVNLTTDESKASYGFGLQFGNQLRRNDFEGLDLDAVVAGLRHWYSHQQTALAQELINPSYQVIQQRQQQKTAELARKRAALAEQFLAANEARAGVSTTASGLQYEVLERGSGNRPGAARPGPRSTVVTHYHGTLVDGTVFDSSVARGEPAEFGVHEVIPAWTEALQMMSVGDKWRIACPPGLAYGERGAGDAIAPNSTLVFDIHLIAIKD